MLKKTVFKGKFKSISVYLNMMVVVLYLVGIFFMSNQDGFTSNGYSYTIIAKVMNKIGVHNYNLHLYNLIFRKLLHFLEFTFLNFIIFMLLRNFISKFKNQLLMSLYMVLVFAIIDEVHQLFILGRTAKFYDVIIDFSGAIFSTIFILIVRKIKQIIIK